MARAAAITHNRLVCRHASKNRVSRSIYDVAARKRSLAAHEMLVDQRKWSAKVMGLPTAAGCQ
jgi:hypothetical protein